MLFCDLRSQYRDYQTEIQEAFADVLKDTSFIQGHQVKLLEGELAHYTGVKHCVTCGSGTDALVLALKATGIGEGDEVITTPFSFFATAEAISMCGAVPRFVDIEPDSYNIDPTLIEGAITPKTRAITPVSLFGQTPAMDDIQQIAKRHRLTVIEDAAQSFGATYRGRFSCAMSTVAGTSFYPTKPLGCYGDGGALFTDDDAVAEAARQLANHGQQARNTHVSIGMNSRLDTLQASVLRVRLAHLDEELAERELIAQRYISALSGIEGFVLPAVKDDRTSVWAQFTIQVPDRAAFREHLSSLGVPTAVYYEVPIYRQPVYAHLDVDPADFPVTEQVCRHVVSLPMSSHISLDDQNRVIAAVNEFVLSGCG